MQALQHRRNNRIQKITWNYCQTRLKRLKKLAFIESNSAVNWTNIQTSKDGTYGKRL